MDPGAGPIPCPGRFASEESDATAFGSSGFCKVQAAVVNQPHPPRCAFESVGMSHCVAGVQGMYHGCDTHSRAPRAPV